MSIIYKRSLVSFFTLLFCVFVFIHTEIFAQIPYKIIYDIAWSPDGKSIAYSYSENEADCGFNNKFVVLLDTQNREILNSFQGQDCAVLALDWSPDGSQLTGASLDTLGFSIWDIETGQKISTSQIRGQGNISIKWHPILNQIISGDIVGSGNIYDVETGNHLRYLDVPAGQLDLSPDGTQLLSSSLYENTVYVFNITINSIVMRLNGHTDVIASVDWSPDSSKLASASSDNTVKIWDADTGENLITFSTTNITKIRWHPNSRQIAVASSDGFVQVWDTETGQITDTYTNVGRVYAVAWSPDGTRLAYGGVGNTEVVIVEPTVIVSPTPTPSLDD